MMLTIGILIGVLIGASGMYLYLSSVHRKLIAKICSDKREDRVRKQVNAYQLENTHSMIEHMASFLDDEKEDRDKAEIHNKAYAEDREEHRKQLKAEHQEHMKDIKEERAERKDEIAEERATRKREIAEERE